MSLPLCWRDILDWLRVSTAWVDSDSFSLLDKFFGMQKLSNQFDVNWIEMWSKFRRDFSSIFPALKHMNIYENAALLEA